MMLEFVEFRQRNEWMDDGACRGKDPGLFFPETVIDPRIRAAKEICQACGVRPVCLDYAIENKESRGILGGHTEVERGRIARSRRAQRANNN